MPFAIFCLTELVIMLVLIAPRTPSVFDWLAVSGQPFQTKLALYTSCDI
jgi:hypothetical protein